MRVFKTIAGLLLLTFLALVAMPKKKRPAAPKTVATASAVATDPASPPASSSTPPPPPTPEPGAVPATPPPTVVEPPPAPRSAPTAPAAHIPPIADCQANKDKVVDEVLFAVGVIFERPSRVHDAKSVKARLTSHAVSAMNINRYCDCRKRGDPIDCAFDSVP